MCLADGGILVMKEAIRESDDEPSFDPKQNLFIRKWVEYEHTIYKCKFDIVKVHNRILYYDPKDPDMSKVYMFAITP